MSQVQRIDGVVDLTQHVAHGPFGRPLRASSQIEVTYQVGRGHTPQLRKRVFSVRDDDELVLSELDRGQLGETRALDDRAVERARHHAAIELGGGLDEDVELDARVTACELGQVRREIVRRAGGAGAHVQRTGLQLFHRLGGVVHHLDTAQGGSAGLGERPPGIRQTNPPPVALEQLQPDCTLEVPHLLGHGALGQVKRRRRARDVLGLRDRHERPKLLQSVGRLPHRDILVVLMESITNS